MMELRPATEGDLTEIARIYNDAILNSVATFDTEPKSADDMRRWLEEHGERYPVVVCLSEGRIVGYAALSGYSPKKAYAATAEVSVYVDAGSRGQGFGRTLLGGIIEAGALSGLHALIARITDGNEASVHLFEQFDFERVGRLREVGRKFGRLLDVDIYQRTIEDPRGGK
jgi:phosphinothricin acetyltransferase